ncbi:MAG: Ig-like domain-containing protein [Candidatus Eremiobacteraeota bacterium]|nr:Ig-like domain-containing protein [Candidatus Eremiobacteraeota bacterium]
MAACHGGGAPAPLVAVSPLPAPTLPSWVADYGPKGQADTLAQIRVIFKEPLIPLEQLESASENDKLKYFRIEPALAGHFRFLTPKMVGFQADQAIPKATRVKVIVGAGLTDLKNNRLPEDLAWTFTSESIAFTDLPGEQRDEDQSPLERTPTLKVTANTELDAGSLAKSTALVASKDNASTAVTATLEKTATPPPDSNAAESFDPSLRNYIYDIKPVQELEGGTNYSLVISPGVQPARGNVASAKAFRGRFATYGPLALTTIGTSGTDAETSARFTRGDPVLHFNNGLDATSASKAITISPPPRSGTTLLNVSDGDRTVALNPWSLEPARSYTVKIAANLKDQFGQTLGKDQTASFSTSDLSADFWAPAGLNIFANTNRLRLDFSAVNVSDGHYQAAYRPISPSQISALDGDVSDATKSMLPSPEGWTTFPASGARNQILTLHVPVQGKLGSDSGMLAYGARAVPHNRATYYGIVGLTNLGVFAQLFPQAAYVTVQHLADGSPAAGARIDVYRAKTSSPCASTLTDKGGAAQLSLTDVERCSAGAQSDAAPSLFVIAREGADWTYTSIDDNSGYSYGAYLGWSNGKPISRGQIFSDRQMYQPGEHAMLTGAAYYLQNGTLKRDARAKYAVSITDSNGAESKLGTALTDEYGIFSLRWNVKANQPLGFYSIKAVGENGNELDGDLRVAEFKPPNFNASLALNKKFAVVSSDVNATGASSYLFGSPLQGANARFFVTRQQSTVQPKGWDQYQFGRQWFWPDEAPTVETDVLQQDTTLDAQGHASQAIHVADDLPYPMDYRVDFEVSDVSRLSVSDSKTFTALPSDLLIGLQNDFVGDEKKAVPVKVIVTDPNGAAQSGKSVHVELQSMDYSAATQLIEGGQSARNAVKYTTVDQTDVTSATAPVTISLTPPKAGAYRVRATIAGAKSDASETDTQIWVSGPEAVRWNAENPSQLKISLDKASYHTGDVATALLQSPYPEADVYLTVVRQNILYKSVAHVSGGAPRVHFRVTPDMLPNAAVEAVLVRRGKPLQQLAAGSLDSLVKIGFASFTTNVDRKHLKVGIHPANGVATPGGPQRVTLSLNDAGGQPIRGEFAVMVVNDAILQLTGYRLPDLVQTVYAEQPISTRLNDNRPNVVLTQLASPIAKGFGYGGGFMQGAGSTRVRRNFQPLAFYNGALKTDGGGKAQFSVTLPDDVTTWRVMAIAVGGQGQDYRFGVGDATFISRKPILANPLLPQFARTGDRMQGGVSLTNTTGSAGQATISGTLSGALQFDQNGALSSSTRVQTDAATGTQAVRFPMLVGEPKPTTMQFNATLGSNSDAFEIPFEVRNSAITESFTQAGATQATASLPISLAAPGTLNIWLGNSVIPQIVAPAEGVLTAQDEPFAEPASSRLIVAASLKQLAPRIGAPLKVNLADEARSDVAALAKLKKDDGGIALWPGGDSDPFLSGYAAQALGRAQRAGLAVDQPLVSGLRKYLNATLANPEKLSWCKSAVCKADVRLSMLLALSELGESRSDFISSIYDQREQFSFAGKARLARYLIHLPGWQSQGNDIADKLAENTYLTARNATANVPQAWQWLDSKDVAQAQLVRLLIARHATPELLDNAVRTLSIEHCSCPWINTYDTAQKLMALTDYALLQPSNQNFSATASIGSTVVGTVRFQGARPVTHQLTVNSQNVGTGQKTLSLQKNGTGTLHYVVAYTYRLVGEQAGALSGLRVTRTVRRANEETVLAQMGLSKPSAATLAPAAVYDIGLEIISDHPVDHVMITDPLPAGLEAVDTAFETSTPYFQAKADSWQIDYQTIYKDRIFAYADHLGPGIYSLHYLVRSVTSGTFAWPGAEAHLEFAPEEFGRSAATTLTITG